jgi:drug/metabolite transporter (DMT)-like permease
MSPHRIPRGALLALILAAAAWGVGTVVSKRAVAEIPPLTLLPIQLAASLVVLAALMTWRRVPLRDPDAPPILVRLGLLNPGLAYALGLLGLVHISASLSVLLWALEPLMILVLAAWFLGEPIGRVLVAFSLVAVAGMALVVYEPGAAGALPGIALTIAGIACCAVYTVVARRRLGSDQATAPVVLGQQVYALALALGLVGIFWLAGGAVRPTAVTPTAWASAIVSGVLYYGFAYWLYLTGLRRVSASIAAVSFYLIPAFGVLADAVLLEQRLEPRQWLGIVVVVAAVAVIGTRMGGRSTTRSDALEVRTSLP